MPLAGSPGQRTAAVLGRPVGHSLSPVLHAAAYRALGLDWTYTAIDCDEAGLAAQLAGSGPELAGYSCTMPLKRQALRLASSASPVAVAIGAANTLLPGPDGWHADNTDWVGIRDVLAPSLPAEVPRPVLLGAGGTAQAALAALAALAPGVMVRVLVRDPGRTSDLVAAAARLGVELSIGRLDQLADLAAAELVISTLPAGVLDQLAGRVGWRAGQLVLDVVYQPWPTVLADTAGQAGADVVSGARMLLLQACGQVELMTGRAAPVEAMRAALLAAVPGCGG